MTYKTSKEFLKMFGLTSLKELPPLPKYKLDKNRQIVIDEIIEENEEAPEPERESADNSVKIDE